MDTANITEHSVDYCKHNRTQCGQLLITEESVDTANITEHSVGNYS